MKLNEKITDKKISYMRFLFITFSFSLLIMYLEPIAIIVNFFYYSLINPMRCGESVPFNCGTFDPSGTIQEIFSYNFIRFIFIGISSVVFVELGLIIFKIRWFEKELDVTKSNGSFPNFIRGYIFSICAYMIKMDSYMGTNFHLKMIFRDSYPSGNFSFDMSITLAIFDLFLILETFYNYTAWKKLKNNLLLSPNPRLILNKEKSAGAIQKIQMAVIFFFLAYFFPLIGYSIDVFNSNGLGISVATTIVNGIGLVIMVIAEVFIILGYFLLGINIKKKTRIPNMI